MFATYGDGIGTIALDELLAYHRSEGRIGTVTGVRPTSRYGELRVDSGEVLEFDEKPTKAEGFVSGGFFVLQREFFGYLGDDPLQLFENEPMQKLAREGQLSMYEHEGFWMGMDTLREYTALSEMWDRGDAPWKVWE